MSVTVTPAPTREQLFEVLAALRAAGDTLHVLHEPDSAVGEYFREIAHRLQDDFFGKEHVEDDNWISDPIEVELQARSAEIEAEALEEAAPLNERIRTLRAMAPRYRELRTIDVKFNPIIRCDSCGTVTNESGQGWRAVRQTDERGYQSTVLSCPKCAKERGDAG